MNQSQSGVSNHSEILKYFRFSHLEPKLAGVCEPFSSLAWQIELAAPSSAEKIVALRKLLESRDAFVRAVEESL